MREACVLVTVYNGAPWIDEALDSALAQRDVDFEILVIDDGSTDETPAILERRAALAPERIRVVTIPQSGLSKARNVGFEHADAEFVTALDADDRMHPLRVRLECDALRAHPDAILSFAGRWNFDDGLDVGTYGFTPEAFGARPGALFTCLDEPVAAMLEAGEYPGTDACTVRTDWARAEGTFREDFRSFVDGERWVRAVHDRQVVYVAAPLYERRVHERAMSAASPSVVQNLFTVVDEARAHWQDYAPRTQRALDAFDKQAGTWIGRRAVLSGERAEGLAHLLRHAGRLQSPFWWRTLAFALTPSFVHRGWRAARATPATRTPEVPRHVITVDDPRTVWCGSSPVTAATEER